MDVLATVARSVAVLDLSEVNPIKKTIKCKRVIRHKIFIHKLTKNPNHKKVNHLPE
jgi:hypothetical protein